MSAPVDPVELKRVQREQWSISAIAWLRWWSVFENGAQVVNDALCDMARLVPGQNVLDLASGLGEPTFTAARRVLPGGTVIGVDLAPQMVAFVRERAIERGATNARFEEGDGENLRFEPGTFDVAVSRWGLMLMPQPERAAASVRRVLKPRSLFAAAVWSTADEVPFIGVPQRVAQEELGVPIDPDAPGPLRMGSEGMLERCLVAAGFQEIESRVVRLTMRFASVEEVVAFQRDMGPLKRAMETAPADVQARAMDVFAREAKRFAGSDGVVRFENRCRLAVGRA